MAWGRGGQESDCVEASRPWSDFRFHPKVQPEGLGGLAQGRDRTQLTFAEDHSAFRVGNRVDFPDSHNS